LVDVPPAGFTFLTAKCPRVAAFFYHQSGALFFAFLRRAGDKYFVVRFLARSALLRAGLRRKEGIFGVIFGTTSQRQTRCAHLVLNAQVVP
jgi:hypothetical protein